MRYHAVFFIGHAYCNPLVALNYNIMDTTIKIIGVVITLIPLVLIISTLALRGKKLFD